VTPLKVIIELQYHGDLPHDNVAFADMFQDLIHEILDEYTIDSITIEDD
jgi:hypothetical protein